MSQSQKKLKKRQRAKLKRIFLRACLITLIIAGIGIGTFTFVYNKFFGDGSNGILSNKKQDPINKTVAVFGVDEDGYRTDIIFVLNFNSETGRTRIISVPRDTRVEWSDDMRERMDALKGYSVAVSKLNEMTSYVGLDNIGQFTIPEMEDLLGIQIDNYVVVTIDAFRQIVDDIGGVEVDVPVLNGNGLQYDDNAQNLHIHLSPGLQVLNGEQAEGLVRFRKGYAEGDVGRIKTQQLFFEAFVKKVTSPQIITKLPSIATTVAQKVITDVSMPEMLSYIPYVKSVNPSDLKCSIIPGEAEYQGGKSYFIPDEAAMPMFIEEALHGNEPSEEVVIDKTVSIQILNATGVNGLAGKAKEMLEQNGYTVSNIGNYTEGILDQTMIRAKEVTKGEQFKAYYSQAVVEQSTTQTYDIEIVLGNDSIE